MIRLVRPDSPRLWAIAGQLVDEYAASLSMGLEFQNFARERQALAAAYGAPQGFFLLARHQDAWAGCGGWRHFSETACEMKRLFVRPERQGGGVGRAIATALIADARARGYSTMLLDTWPSMTAAQGLYRSLGFEPAAPYRFNPVAGTQFFQLRLEPLRRVQSLSRCPLP